MKKRIKTLLVTLLVILVAYLKLNIVLWLYVVGSMIMVALACLGAFLMLVKNNKESDVFFDDISKNIGLFYIFDKILLFVPLFFMGNITEMSLLLVSSSCLYFFFKTSYDVNKKYRLKREDKECTE